MGTMNTFLRVINEWFTDSSSAASAKVEVRRTYVRSRGRESVIVQRDPRPYWQERGWTRERGVYQGDFQTPFGTCQGYGTVSPSGRVEIFIHNPPASLKRHPHWPCFRERNSGWFFVHPVSRVPDISAAILSVEKTIAESYAI
jgi:hypothetical protein